MDKAGSLLARMLASGVKAPFVYTGLKDVLKEALAEIQQAKEPHSVAFSDISESQAGAVYRQLNITLIDGNEQCPIIAGSTGFVDCGQFDMAKYIDEKEATEPFLSFIKSSLLKHDVLFECPEGFKIVDLREKRKVYELVVEDTVFKGGLDGAIVPFGVSKFSAAAQLRCAVEVKHSDKHKAEYKKRRGQKAKQNADDITFTGSVKGQALVEALAACIYAEYPSVILLLSSFDHNTVIEWSSDRVRFWEEVTFDAAMHKVGEFLKSCDPNCSYQWKPATMPASSTEQQGDELVQRLRKKLRPSSLALEQLDTLTAGMDQQEKFLTAFEYFASFRQQGDEWQHMFG